ncbi:DUF4112 domain-containing protein [Picosynechococcus sp. PCC 7117]|uniref:DUF4112 domain-containing protein n=1 Tax=Picosynechococcus sp. PCC 7117 TaxID=195498 RepID=UPI000810A147|nr:DUF4112 domain-containing protein [Picosynechococcus sp. PCC 7117]ANV87296.1 hypothetical protein AWQ22_07390 [Picosynechococcus sp. PCC 7117]
MTATKTPNPKTLKRIRTLSKLLDSAIAIPGTKYKIGLDPIIGLVPAVGDYLSLILSGYVIFEAAKLGAKQDTLVKMALNLLVDSVVGTVPVAGDLFDVAWKANEANLKLLEQDLPDQTDLDNVSIDWRPLILILGAIALVILLGGLLTLWLLKLVFNALF